MHPMIAEAQIAQVQQRKSEGDCPTTPALSVESLEDLVLHYVGGNEGSAAVRDVLAERRRQMSSEGFGPEHDDEHGRGEMAKAAAAYAYHTTAERAAAFAPAPYGTPYHERPPLELAYPPRSLWPWDVSWWKPTDRRRDLVKAGALILAEIERLDRAAPENRG